MTEITGATILLENVTPNLYFLAVASINGSITVWEVIFADGLCTMVIREPGYLSNFNVGMTFSQSREVLTIVDCRGRMCAVIYTLPESRLTNAPA